MLAGVLLMHLVLLYAVISRPGMQRRIGLADTGQELFITLPRWLPQTAPRARPAVLPRTARPVASVAGQAPAPVLAPRSAAADAIAAADATAAATEPAVTVTDQVAPALPDGAAIRAQARRDIGAIDKALRGNAPLVPPQRPASMQSTLEEGFAAANVGASTAVVDFYTAPDGVLITRILRNGHYVCRMSGTVNFVPGIVKNAEKSKGINCPPADSGWHK